MIRLQARLDFILTHSHISNIKLFFFHLKFLYFSVVFLWGSLNYVSESSYSPTVCWILQHKSDCIEDMICCFFPLKARLFNLGKKNPAEKSVNPKIGIKDPDFFPEFVTFNYKI